MDIVTKYAGLCSENNVDLKNNNEICRKLLLIFCVGK